MTTAAITAELEKDARSLQDALTQLTRVVQFRDRDCVCCYDVSVAQSHALERLSRVGPTNLKDFATALFLEKSSASRLVDGLVRKGYVKRKPDPADARSVALDLTKRGRALWQRIERDLLEERGRVLADLAPGERAAAIRSIKRLAEAASALVVRQGGACVRV